MIFDYAVKKDGIYYTPGEDVPMTPEEEKEELEKREKEKAEKERIEKLRIEKYGYTNDVKSISAAKLNL